MLAPSSLAPLQAFRTDLSACFGRRRDALFELTDAALTAGWAPSLVHLSLAAAHRRSWGSLSAALAKGQIAAAALRVLLARHPGDDGAPVDAIDTSAWPRCAAETSPERGFSDHPARHSAGQPIGAGWSSQWLAQLSSRRDSWTAPLDVRRVPPQANVQTAAAEQIRSLLAAQPADAPTPTFVFDAGSDPERLARELGDLPVAVLVRLRRDRCFSADPTEQPPTGRPRRHGTKFVCKDPTTWPAPDDEVAITDTQYGRVRVRAWGGLHAKSQSHPGRGSRRTRPVVRGTLILVEVERLPAQTRAPQQLWLWWRGPGIPDLDLVWRADVRRFDLEHTLRFGKQVLNWATPRVRHPDQADRWTGLVVAAYTQLRLARRAVQDRRLPWERPLSADRLTPGRVRQALTALLPALGSPADPPKPCGRSPGRPKGRLTGPARRFPALKKTA